MNVMHNNGKSKIAKGVAVGIVIGSAVCAVAMGCGAMKPKKKTVRYKAASVLDTVGSVMQNIADCAR